MGLKIEDLENELKNKNLFENESDSQASVRSQNLIQHSMKQAIKAMQETQETSRDKDNIDQVTGMIKGPPRKYEKQIEKLEGDIRMHFRVSNQIVPNSNLPIALSMPPLEHETKIHMDYLENKLELHQPQAQKWAPEKAKLMRQLEMEKGKLQLVKDNKDQAISDLKRKLADTTENLKQFIEKKTKIERQYS